MKKLFIFLVMSIICLDARSQGKLKVQSKFGFKLGTGIQSITGCPVKTQPRVAFMGGIWVQIKISKCWTMQAELTNIGKGTGGENQQQPRYGDYWLQLSYFEIPILFQYNRKNGYFECGPSIAALINSGEYSKGGAIPYPTDLYPFSNKDFSFNIGAGYIVNDKWFVGLRLTHSLLPIRKQLPELSQPVYNRGIILSVSREISFKFLRSKKSQVSD